MNIHRVVMNPRQAVRGASLAGLLLLAGCLPDFQAREPVPDTFLLVAAPLAGAAKEPPATAGGSITLRLPTVRGGWEGTRVPVRLADGRLEHIAEARWARPVDEGLAAVLTDTLRAHGVFTAVLSDLSPFPGRWVLEVEVHEFSAVYTSPDQPPTVQVALSGTLGRGRDRTVLGTVAGTAEVDARYNSRTAIAAAFNLAVQTAVAAVTADAERLARADVAVR